MIGVDIDRDIVMDEQENEVQTWDVHLVHLYRRCLLFYVEDEV